MEWHPSEAQGHWNIKTAHSLCSKQPSPLIHLRPTHPPPPPCCSLSLDLCGDNPPPTFPPRPLQKAFFHYYYFVCKRRRLVGHSTAGEKKRIALFNLLTSEIWSQLLFFLLLFFVTWPVVPSLQCLHKTKTSRRRFELLLLIWTAAGHFVVDVKSVRWFCGGKRYSLYEMLSFSDTLEDTVQNILLFSTWTIYIITLLYTRWWRETPTAIKYWQSWFKDFFSSC